MPALQTMLSRFNAHFSEQGIENLARDREKFAPGCGLQHAVNLVSDPRHPLNSQLHGYVAGIPPTISESIRSVIYSALSTNPPTQVTFAWAPSYDFELSIWQAPDTAKTRGGATVLFKSRYPDDRHPLARAVPGG